MGQKYCLSFHQSCYSHAIAYFSILLSYADCHLCKPAVDMTTPVNVIIKLNQRVENIKTSNWKYIDLPLLNRLSL